MWNLDTIPDLSGKVAVVTGGNRGLGYFTAQRLAEKGADVVIACRDPQRAQTAVSQLQQYGVVSAMSLDLADLRSVKAFSDAFKGTSQRLDLLINNAGVMALPLMHTADGFEMQFGTNHLGHFALTGHLMGLILKTAGSRIVNISSNAHRFGRIRFDDLQREQRYGKLAAYGQSKLANLLFTLELQARFSAQGCTSLALSAHPGMAGTELGRVEPGKPMGPLDRIFRNIGMKLIPGPDAGARPTLRAATDPNVQGGEYFGPWLLKLVGAPIQENPAARAREKSVAERLWQASEALTGVQYLN